MSATFGDLRSLLQSSHLLPEEQWRQLCDIVEQFAGEELEEVILPYCLAHLERIPLETRRVPLRWLERLLRSEALPFLTIAAVLDTEARSMRLENIGAEVLAKTPHLDHLRVLTLRRQLIHSTGLEHLLGAYWMEDLEQLHLDENLLGDSGIAMLAASAPWPSLDTLSLRATGIARSSVDRLFDSSLMLRLKRLDLSRNDIGWGIGAALRPRLPKARHLEYLALNRCGLVRHDAKLLGEAILDAPSLRHVEVGENALGDLALAEMFEAMRGSTLERISLERNGIDTAAIQTLAGLPSLREVSLAELSLPNLAPLTRHPNLRRLDVAQSLGSDVLSSCFHTVGTRLTHLRLASDALPLEVMLELVTSPLVDTLTHLTLDAAQLQRAHIKLLCTTSWRNLEHLSLRLNQLGDDEVDMIARARGFETLTSIDLTHNVFGAASARALADRLAANRARQV